MSAYSDTLERIRRARQDRDRAASDLHAAKLKLQQHLRRARAAAPARAQAPLPDPRRDKDPVDPDAEALRARIVELKAEESRRVQNLEGAIAGLYNGKTPQELLQEWDDRLPIALLPLRMETKFLMDGPKPQLRVRIYPDTIAVVTHEAVLTQVEVEYGTAYWKALFDAADDEARKAAWRLIADKFGANRAAWVARESRPTNWEAAGLVDAGDLVFPQQDATKIAPWSEAPHTRVLPDRFVLVGFKGGKAAYTDIGQPIPDIVVLGPAPLGDGDKPSLTRDPATGRLQHDEAFRWALDFDRAVEQGLGFRVPFHSVEAAKAGFDQLLVLGLKASADEQDGKDLMQALLENHHYSRKGLALVPQGTPTNNTDERDAGFSSRDPLQALSFYTEALDPLFEPTDDKALATDGQRLAEYLGLDYGVFQHVAHADATDHAEAVAMNQALYAGTLGYYSSAMLNDVLSEDAQQRLRAHFTRLVTGRGPVAALRVGNQPYGLLPTAAFARWQVTGGIRPDADRPRQQQFLFDLHRILSTFVTLWQRIVPQLAQLGRGGDASKALAAVLGLQPTSVEYFQRIGVSLDYLRNLEQFHAGQHRVWDLFKSEWDNYLSAVSLRQLGHSPTRPGGQPKPSPLLLQLLFKRRHTPLDARRLVDPLPLAEDRGLDPYDKASGRNYIDWLHAAADAQTVEDEDFQGAPKPTTLLYMMLRYARLHETARSAARFLAKHDIDAQVLHRSRKFANLSAAPTVSYWEVFHAPAGELVAAEATNAALFNHLHSARFDAPAQRDVVADLRAHQAALAKLRGLPTARLERLFAEHLDTLTYRLDAWQTSLFDQRLREHRALDAPAGQRRLGQYLGAYGYLEDVRPELGRRVAVPEQTLPEPLRERKENLFVDTASGGHVHAPSLNHATAAAILRSAYLTHADPSQPDRFAIDLSSARVRRAMAVVQGLRNGQTLEVLLGYQFERGLHDWSTRKPTPVVLNDLLPLLRSALPITRTRVPQAGKTTGPEETVTDEHVVNGLELARRASAFPWGVALPSGLAPEKVAALKAEKQALEQTLDALRDLHVSESAFQLAMGNFERAAAVMQALGAGDIPAEFEVVEAARGTQMVYTQRITLHFDPGATANPWAPIAISPRAGTEAGLNHWLGTLLGSPTDVACRVRAVDAQGQTLRRADSSEQLATITLDQLKLQPLDLIYLVGNRVENGGASELEARLRSLFLVGESLPDDSFVRIDFADPSAISGPDGKTFAELLALARHLRALITEGKPLGASSYTVASKSLGPRPPDPDQIDFTDLTTRLDAVTTAYDTLAGKLPGAIDNLATLGTLTEADALRELMREFAHLGTPFAWPQSVRGADPAAVQGLLEQARSLQRRIDAATSERDAQRALAAKPSASAAQKLEALTAAARQMLGADFVLLPRFRFTDVADVAAAHAERDKLLDYARTTLGSQAVVDEFLHGVAQVRSRMHRLEMVVLLAQALGGASIEAEPLQLPHRSGDAWLATDFPAGTTLDHDTLSFAILTPQGFDATAVQCGLVIDQWTEALPNADEVTGLTFNYNNPNSMPAQAILLAVAPQLTGRWQWEHLVEGVLDTFARARQRAVEPDQIDANGVMTILLPALVSEFSTTRSGLSLDHALSLEIVAQRVGQLLVPRT